MMKIVKSCVLLACVLFSCADAAPNARGGIRRLNANNNVRAHDPEENYADFLKIYSDLAYKMLHEPEQFENNNNVETTYSVLDDDLTKIPFPCQPKGPQNPVPTSVHSLTPADIGVVAALGDSITAGNGIRATSPIMVAFINRGESFSVGGDRTLEEGVLTLPNILKKYNKDLQGESYCGRTKLHTQAGYNVALPGATNLNLFSQATELINKFAKNLTVFYDEWKVITLLIGGNDLCQHCMRDGLSAEQYKIGIEKALDLLHKHVPRAFVNLVIMADVSVVPELIHPNSVELCETLHAIECACANVTNTTEEMYQLQRDYYEQVNELIETDKYDTRDDFTVVVQPFLLDQKPLVTANGTYDMRYFAPDCFHPSYKSHQFFAFQLWNSMLIKYGDKPTYYDESKAPAYMCPTDSFPYFYTKKNSQ